jgi:hypothetical protein
LEAAALQLIDIIARRRKVTFAIPEGVTGAFY